MAHRTRFASLAGLTAAISMAATPAQAAELPTTTPTGTMGYATSVHAAIGEGADNPFRSSTYDAEADTAEWRRGWGRWGRWGRGGYGWRRGWRGRRGIRGGDILAGAIILGGIAAVASAANNRRRDRDVVIVERDRRYDDRRDYDYRPERRRTDRRISGGSGIDNAVSMCLNEVERDVRVDSVDGASRLAEGWVVTGTIYNGESFSCQIDNSGRVSDIDYLGFSSSATPDLSAPALSASGAAAGQWSDDRYASARADMGSPAYLDDALEAEDAGSEALPAYPGGPLPGEALSE
jgi:hypothetical protein